MMDHLNDEILLERYYGDPEAGGDEHLNTCEECRSRYQRLQRVLNSVNSLAAPERPADYEEQLWRKLAPKVQVSKKRAWFASPVLRYALAASLMIGAFWAGWAERTQVAPSPDRDTVLALAVDEHLERAQLILAQLSNDDSQSNIAYERGTAEELLQSNRLYRQAAMFSGDDETAEILDGLERALMEIARSSPDASPEELHGLRQEIRGQGILTQVRDFETKLKTQL